MFSRYASCSVSFLFTHASNEILNTLFFFRLYGWVFGVSQSVEALRDKPKSSVFFHDGIHGIVLTNSFGRAMVLR